MRSCWLAVAVILVVPLAAGCGSRDPGAPDLATNALSAPNFCLQFDGDDDYVRVPNDRALKFDTQDSFTIECWFRTEALYTPYDYQVLIGTWSGSTDGDPYPYELRLRLGTATVQQAYPANLEFAVYDGTLFDSANAYGPWNDGLWHHVAGVREGTTRMRIYVDGAIRAEVTPNPQLLSILNARPVTFGGYRLGWATLNGDLDEVRIWNIARTRRQIRADMNRRVLGDAPGLAGLWRFDEGRGFVAHDSTANENDGGLLGVPRWVAASRPHVP